MNAYANLSPSLTFSEIYRINFPSSDNLLGITVPYNFPPTIVILLLVIYSIGECSVIVEFSG